MKDEFPEIGSPDVCTNPAGFKEKEKAHAEKLVSDAQLKGERVLSGKQVKGLFQEDHYMNALGNFTLKRGQPYVDLKSKPDWDKKERTFEEIIGKHLPEDGVLVAFDPAGKRHRLLSETYAKEALEKAGVKVPEPKKEKDWGEERRLQLVKRTERLKMAELGLAQIRQAVGKMKLDGKFLRLLAGRVDGHNISERYKLNQQTRKKFLDGLDEEDAKVFVFEALFCGSLVDWQGDWDDGFQAAAELCGVDLKGLGKPVETAKGASAPATEKKPHLFDNASARSKAAKVKKGGKKK
jgi:hypothetical protein